jgi:hypothetical protein
MSAAAPCHPAPGVNVLTGVEHAAPRIRTSKRAGRKVCPFVILTTAPELGF